MERSYSQDEVEEILRRAVRNQRGDDELDHGDLLAAARAAGIDEEAVRRAVAEFDQQRDRENLAERVKHRRRSRFTQSLVTYLIVNGFLATIDGMSGGGLQFVQWVLLGWGLPLALQARRAFFPSGEDLARATGKEARRLERQRRLEARQQAQRRRTDAQGEFEAMVQQGLQSVMDSLGASRGGATSGGRGVRARVDPSQDSSAAEGDGEERSRRGPARRGRDC